MKIIFFLFFTLLISCQPESHNKVDFSRKNISYKELDHETGWIRIKLNSPNKWGFINKDSLIMIPFEYDFLNPFEGGLAYAKNKGKEFFITKNNLRLEGDFDALDVFSEGLASVKKNNKWGFINEKGVLVIPLMYDKVDYFRANGLSAVTRNKKSGFINTLGKEIIPIIYDDVNQQMIDQNVIVKKNNKWAVFDNSGKQLSDFIYDNVKRTDIVDFSKDIFSQDKSTYFENGAALVEVNGKYEFINAKAQAAFPNNKFDSASTFDTFKNAIVKRNGKYGIIKTNGTFKVPLEYDFIEYFDTNHAFSEYYNAKKGKVYCIFNRYLEKIGESYEPVYNDFSTSNLTLAYKNLKGKIGVVDWRGKIIIPFEYDSLTEVENTSFFYAKKGNLNGIISEKGQIKIPIKYRNIYSVYDEFDSEESSKKLLFIADETVIDISNNIVISGYNSITPLHYNRDKLIVSKNKKFGIIHINKKVLLPLEYDEVSNWVEYGPEKRHFIKKNGKYGLIEYETFRTIIPAIYDKFVQVGNLIFVTRNGKSGILDLNNKEICPLIFDEIRPYKYFRYNDGKNKGVYSKRGGKYFQINLYGKVLKQISEKEYKENTEFKNI